MVDLLDSSTPLHVLKSDLQSRRYAVAGPSRIPPFHCFQNLMGSPSDSLTLDQNWNHCSDVTPGAQVIYESALRPLVKPYLELDKPDQQEGVDSYIDWVREVGPPSCCSEANASSCGVGLCLFAGDGGNARVPGRLKRCCSIARYG
jgi:hypothetical protein